MSTVAIVFGTYNRFPLLQRAIASVRRAVGEHHYTIIAVDGGSTDGSREWLRHQPNTMLMEQTGPLSGAVKAFNLGFGRAVDAGFDFVMHLNDDAEIVTDLAIAKAIDLMAEDPKIGEVAFAFDLNGNYHFDHINGQVYANFGVIRREAGMAVAKRQGDPSGRAWWNPIYRTYGADTEFGAWLWRLGYSVYSAWDLRVHDLNQQDELRKLNEATNPDRADSKLFWARWRDAVLDPGPAGRDPVC